MFSCFSGEKREKREEKEKKRLRLAASAGGAGLFLSLFLSSSNFVLYPRKSVASRNFKPVLKPVEFSTSSTLSLLPLPLSLFARTEIHSIPNVR